MIRYKLLTPTNEIESAAACVRNVHRETREIATGVWLATDCRMKSSNWARYTSAAMAESG